MAFINQSKFLQARIQLSIWYTFILFLIIVFFSAVLFSMQTFNMKSIMVHQFRQFHPSGFVTKEDIKIFNQQISALQNEIFFNILTLDCVVLFLSALLSYFLAGITLKPIDETIKTQKEFIADISHELRTPIAAIQTACEVTLRANNKTEADYRKMIIQTLDEIKRLHKMTEDLLTLSRTDFIHDAQNFSECALDTILLSVVENVKDLALEKNIEISILELQRVNIRANRDKIKQLILILLDNAIKFNKSNGKITLTLLKKPFPTFIINDTGIGIPKEALDKIFDRHYQALGTHLKASSGLGLTIAKKIADLHNAKISVTSEKGVGSHFTITFNS